MVRQGLRGGMRVCGAVLLAVGVVTLLLAVMWTGEAPADVPPAEEAIQQAILRVAGAARALEGARAAEGLAAAFRVPPRTITSLQDQKLDFGEVAVVLALAEAGRVSADRILGLWASARLDWAQIAAQLRVEVTVVLTRLETVRHALAGSPPPAARR